MKLTVLLPPGRLIEAACVRPQMRMVNDPAHLAFEAADMNRIEPDKGSWTIANERSVLETIRVVISHVCLFKKS